MQKLASKKLMENLTGKETFAAIMQTYADMLAARPVTFSDEALDRAKVGLAKRPEDDRDFYRWCNAKEAMDYVITEIRVDAMQANWHLSLLINFLYDTMMTERKKTPEELTEYAARIQYRLRKITHYQATLNAFSDTLNVDLTPLLRDGIKTLDEHLSLYETMSELFDEYLSFQAGPLELAEDYLPRLTLEPEDTVQQMQAELTESLNRTRGNEFISLIVPLVEASVGEN